MDIQSSGLTGLNNAHQSMLKSASNIASKEAMEGAVKSEKELIEMKQSEQQFSASAKVIKSEDDIMGTLIDIKA